jgi:hypothetical protein
MKERYIALELWNVNSSMQYHYQSHWMISFVSYLSLRNRGCEIRDVLTRIAIGVYPSLFLKPIRPTLLMFFRRKIIQTKFIDSNTFTK